MYQKNKDHLDDRSNRTKAERGCIMFYFRITVIKKISNAEFAQSYCRKGISVCPCPAFEVGQVFATDPGI